MAKVVMVIDLGRAGTVGPPSLGARPALGPVEGKEARVVRAERWAGKQLPRVVSGTLSSPAHYPGLTLWDQHVGQDGEASCGLGVGQDYAVAKDLEQDVVGGWAQEVHSAKQDLEEEDVISQVL